MDENSENFLGNEIFSRNEIFWGENFQHQLSTKKVAVIGLGGVGGFCADSLARSGIGEMLIADFDTVSKSNINRQTIALHSSVGLKKTALWEKRLRDINPDLRLKIIDDFCSEFSLEEYDFVVDAIDTMRSKVSLLEHCIDKKIPVISSLGAGNRIDPTKLYICDISEVKEKNAPFISNVLYQLKKRGISSGITVVTSSEKPKCLKKITVSERIRLTNGDEIEFQKITPSSTPFVASCAGIFMASYIVQKFML